MQLPSILGTQRLFAALLVLTAHPVCAAQPIQLVSASGANSRTGAGNSHAPVITTDGRHVAFVSQANNLVTNDNLGPHLDLFLRDLVASNTVLISVSTNGIGGANDNVTLYTLSSNAQLVAFETAASNLTPGDANRHPDVYVRDVAAGTTTLVSVNTDGSASGNGPSTNPLLSEDGRYVIFESLASNLVTNDFNGTNDIFIRDLMVGTTTLVSVNAEGAAAPTGSSFSPSISASGLFVAFVSRATNLVEGVTNKAGEIYVRDVAGHSTLWAVASHLPGAHSRASASGALETYSASEPALSRDGRHVAFKTLGQTVRFDLQQPTNSMFLAFTNGDLPDLSVNFFQFDANPQLSASASQGPLAFTPDGRFLAYATRTNIVPYPGIIRVDFESFGTNIIPIPPQGSTGGTSFVTNKVPAAGIVVTNFGGADGQAAWVGLSASGQRLFFLSAVTNLVSSAGNGTFQLQVAEVADGRVQLLITNQTGSSGSSLEGVVPAISQDGSMIAWDSPDLEIVASDSNRAWDVFALDMRSGVTHLISARHQDLAEVSERTISLLSLQALSANGRFLAYTVVDAEKETLPYLLDRSARNLVVRDLATGTSLRVGANWPVRLNTLTGASTYFDRPTNLANEVCVSLTGRYLAFSRGDPYLFSSTGVYRADLQDQTISVVSENAGGGAIGGTSRPTISPDGQLVAFVATASGYGGYVLPPLPKGNGGDDIIVRDFRANSVSNRIISINGFSTATGNGTSIQPQFSPSGRWLSFLSMAADLVAGSFPTATFQVYVRDLERDETRLVSFLSANETNVVAMVGGATNPVFSADSRYVAFGIASGTSRKIFRHDLTAAFDGIRTNDLVCVDCSEPSLSADGQFIAYQSWPSGGGITNIVVRDMESGQSELTTVNRFGGAGGNGSSFTPLLSHDARYVVFSSRASDLVADDNNSATDVFVRDRLNGVTHCLSRNRDGSGTGNRVSSHPILSADGRTVAFQSFASDLVSGDYNDTRDVFVVTLGGPDSDGDGMDDDWEMAYFTSLGRDGTGDFDGDGASDLAEFRAGTNPSKDASVLRVITLTTFGNQAQRNTTVIWTAIPGRTYRVQIKETVNEGWADLPGDILAVGTSASKVHTAHAAAGQSFYRVVLVP